MMKLTFWLCLLTMIVLVSTSCGKENPSQNQNFDTFKGEYSIKQMKNSGCNDPSGAFDLDFSESNCTIEQNIEWCTSGHMSLKADGSFTTDLALDAGFLGNLWTMDDEGTYMIEGDIILLCESDGENCHEFGTIDGEIIHEQWYAELGCTSLLRLGK